MQGHNVNLPEAGMIQGGIEPIQGQTETNTREVRNTQKTSLGRKVAICDK